MSRKAARKSSATRRKSTTRKKIKGGYHRRILFVDLSRGKATTRSFGDDFALKYIGGRGFGAKLLYDQLPKIKDPLDPENILVIAPGPLTGSYLPASAKTSFVTLAPLTGIYGDSNMGGSFGPELRQAGYDALVITGKAKALSYLWVDDDEVRVMPSPQLKGLGSLATEGAIKEELGDDAVKVASIGPAGENLVRFACLSSDWSRNAGRCGMGAVMGSKNLKAIVVRGAKDLPVYDLDTLRKITDESMREIRSHDLFKFWQEQGLMSVIDYVNSAGVLPTRNFRENVFEGASKIDGFQMEARYKIGDTACFACPMCCGNICLVKSGNHRGAVAEGPEYETACLLGSNLGVSDFSAIVRANQLCDELGIDTISTGNLIGVLIEAAETGLLSAKDLDGLRLRWGETEPIIELIQKIANRDGIGDLIADGTRALLSRWPQLQPLAVHVKGMEQSGYDGRATISMALGYGTCDVGAHHSRAWTVAKELEMGADWGPEEKVDLVIYHQTIRPLFDMLGVCRLQWIELGFDPEHYAQFYQAVTGVPATLDDLLEKSRAIYDLTRIINVRQGISRKDDYPAPRMMERPVEGGPYAGRVVNREEYDALLDLYYQKRGWSPDGIPDPKVEAQFKGKLA